MVSNRNQYSHSFTPEDIFPPLRLPTEHCGIFGVWGEGMETARLTHVGLWALQHRGQESSGIATSNGKRMRVVKDEGLVARVYDEANLAKLVGECSIGHNRYGTSGGSGKRHAQPVMSDRGLVALVHNGNLPSTTALENFLQTHNIPTVGLNDSEMMQATIEHFVFQGKSLPHAIKKALPLFTGVFCLLVMTKDCLVAVRDHVGIRPLSLGTVNGGYVFSSETCALDTVGATYMRDVNPGEMIILDKSGLRSELWTNGHEQLDVFEYIYFARPDSVLLGKNVNEVRKNLGRHLAQESLVSADVIIPVPDSAIPSALGYAEVSGIPFDHGLIKNRYIHRTFIRPAQKLREKEVEMKLNPLPGIIKGKKVAIIDDSIVRGTTAKKLVERLRVTGAQEIHFLISCPPVMYPDFYGIDTPKQKKLVASQLSIPKMAEYLGVDSLHFLSYQGMMAAIGVPENRLSASCITGKYPVDIGERKREIVQPQVK